MGAKTPAVKTKAPPPIKKAAAKKTVVAAPKKALDEPTKTAAVAKKAPVAVVAKKETPAAAPRSRGSDRLMSEAEILAAPDRDYMNPAQLHFFKVKLQTMEQDILRNAGETTEHLRESIIVPDPADRATIEEEHALELRTRDRERKLLKKIQQSIHRIDSGEYGYCEETGDPIGVPRLLARPTATLSLEAQERREMKQKMFGE